jgi:ribose/xylose/arabinose/galactoside ABC-type transport system permease subunit
LLTRSLFGRRLYALGMNPRTAAVSGVPVDRIRILAYAACGTCAAVGSILYTARLQTGSPVLGQRILLDVVGAAVIGGTSLFGGRGQVPTTLLGVLFICLIDNSLNMMGLSNFAVMMVKGGVILTAALVDAVRSKVTAAEA